jgi:hypothetical protein
MKMPEFVMMGFKPSDRARPIVLPPQGVSPRVDPCYQPANEPTFKVVLKPA